MTLDEGAVCSLAAPVISSKSAGAMLTSVHIDRGLEPHDVLVCSRHAIIAVL